MELFSTDRERLAFLLETDAALDLDFEALEAQAEAAAEEPSPEQRPKYITNYIGSKQKLVDWIWKHTPDGVESVVDAFSGSAVVAYMYKTKGLRVLANDRLRYCHHAARAIIENDKVRLSDEDLDALLADNAVLLLPTLPDIAPLLNTPPAQLDDFRARAMSLLCIAGLAGLPQVSLPLATLSGCPLGVSLVAGRGNDAMLLALARRIAD
jgi:Asp-tRNA(Asn)/Glu-tRNA(Gln) amidotransferase A subunit family amidase